MGIAPLESMTNVRLSRRGTGVAIVFAALVSASPFSLLNVADAAQPCTKAAAHDAQLADRRTTDEIVRRIASDESVGGLAPQVHVTTSDGVVTLSGAIANHADLIAVAERLVATLFPLREGIRLVGVTLATLEEEGAGEPELNLLPDIIS